MLTCLVTRRVAKLPLRNLSIEGPSKNEMHLEYPSNGVPRKLNIEEDHVVGLMVKLSIAVHQTFTTSTPGQIKSIQLKCTAVQYICSIPRAQGLHGSSRYRLTLRHDKSRNEMTNVLWYQILGQSSNCIQRGSFGQGQEIKTKVSQNGIFSGIFHRACVGTVYFGLN